MILDTDWNIVSDKEFGTRINGKGICVFGDSKNNTLIYDVVPKENIECIFDNNEDKWGTSSNQIQILKPGFEEHSVLVTAVAEVTSLIPQLRGLGYKQWFFFINDEVYERKFSKAIKFMHSVDSDFVWKDNPYKYIHVIPDQKFIYPLSVVLEHSFDMNEHAFLLYGFNESNPQDLYKMWDLYRRMSCEYGNVALAGSLYNCDKDKDLRLKVIDKKLEKCKKIIFHGEWLNEWVFDYFKNKLPIVKAKGCLIAWSGNFGCDKQNDRYIYELLRYCRLLFYRGDNVRFENIKRKIDFCPDTKFLREGPSYSVPSERPEKHSNTRPKVLISHSCFPHNGVIEGLDLLKKYKGQIDIFCCGSYGDHDYMEQVKVYGQSLYGECFHFVDCYMDYNDYLNFINDMDVAFFAENLAAGATTIRMLAYAGKKIYLNENIAEKFANIGIKTYLLEQVENEGIKEFAINQFEEENYRAVNMYFDYESNANLWNKIFEYDFDK